MARAPSHAVAALAVGAAGFTASLVLGSLTARFAVLWSLGIAVAVLGSTAAIIAAAPVRAWVTLLLAAAVLVLSALLVFAAFVASGIGQF